MFYIKKCVWLYFIKKWSKKYCQHRQFYVKRKATTMEKLQILAKTLIKQHIESLNLKRSEIRKFKRVNENGNFYGQPFNYNEKHIICVL